MTSDLSEPLEFRLGWRRALLPLLPLVPILLSSAIAELILRDPRREVRWPAVAALLVVVALLPVPQCRAATRLDHGGLLATEVGRPWRLFRRTAVPWRDVVAIEPRRIGRVFTPVVHLADGGWIRLRVPAERDLGKAEAAIAEMRKWHREGIGHDEVGTSAAAVPKTLARPPARRRALIAVVSVLVIAIDGVLVARPFVTLDDRPPDVTSCELVPITLVRRLLPGGEPVSEADAGESIGRGGQGCRWNAGRAKDESFATDATLTLFVDAFPADFLADEYPDDLADAESQHVTQPIIGLRGFSFSTVRSGVAAAEAYAVVGGYQVRVTLEQTPVAIGATRSRRIERAEAERRVTELVRSVAARLRTVEGWRR